jgi:CRISPR-associated protein Csd1
MSWATALCALYDKNARRAGEIEDWNGKPLVLMPPGYDTMKAQIEITISEDGDFINALTLDKSDSETIVPYPDRRTSGIKALPLCDSLSYVAGDFMERVTLLLEDVPENKKAKALSDIRKSFPSYIGGLKAWHEFDPDNRQIAAIYKYVSKKTVIADLLNAKVLKFDQNGILTDRKKIQGTPIQKAFVRFRVYSPGSQQNETAVWLNKDVQQSFIKFYLSTAKNTDICYFTGKRELIAKTNPVKIRGEWDTKASLISSNDDTNFTYRGRFKTKDKDSGYNEALSIGYETSQKIHNALKWIIRRQGYSHDGVCIVTWESELIELPEFYEGTLEILGSKTEEEELSSESNDALFEEKAENTDTNYITAQDFYAAMDGYSKRIVNTSQMVILALDSTSPGRLAITYFRDLSSSVYLRNLQYWQKNCCWRHEYYDNKTKRYIKYEGMTSIKEIATAIYGNEQNKRLTLRPNSDGKSPMLVSTFDRLRPCIIDAAAIPQDIVKLAVTKASNPLAYEIKFNYLRVLHIACSLVKKYYWEKGVIFDMTLDEKCTDRSYLYGRLLAVAEKIERCTYEKGETRTTNAERYMRQFSQTPFRTWELIRRNTQIYLNQLKPGSREFYKNLYGQIMQLFEEGCFEEKKALDGKFLLGYDCQREALKYRQKDNITISTEDEPENNDEEE